MTESRTREQDHRNSWHAGTARGSLSPDRGQRSASSKPEGGDSGQPASPSLSPVTYSCRPASRNHSLRYSGGALHHTDQPVSFDHNFDSSEAVRLRCKAQSSSPPRSRVRENSGSEGEGSSLTVREENFHSLKGRSTDNSHFKLYIV